MMTLDPIDCTDFRTKIGDKEMIVHEFEDENALVFHILHVAAVQEKNAHFTHDMAVKFVQQATQE